MAYMSIVIGPKFCTILVVRIYIITALPQDVQKSLPI